MYFNSLKTQRTFLFLSTYFMCFHLLKTYLYNISFETINQHLKSKKNNLFINNFKKSINKKLIYLNQNDINQCLDLKGFKMSGLFLKDRV